VARKVIGSHLRLDHRDPKTENFIRTIAQPRCLLFNVADGHTPLLPLSTACLPDVIEA